MWLTIIVAHCFLEATKYLQVHFIIKVVLNELRRGGIIFTMQSQNVCSRGLRYLSLCDSAGMRIVVIHRYDLEFTERYTCICSSNHRIVYASEFPGDYHLVRVALYSMSSQDHHHCDSCKTKNGKANSDNLCFFYVDECEMVVAVTWMLLLSPFCLTLQHLSLNSPTPPLLLWWWVFQPGERPISPRSSPATSTGLESPQKVSLHLPERPEHFSWQ